MAEKLAPPGELFLRKGRESVVSLEMDRLAPGEESSDSEGEQEGGSHRLIRKVSTSGQMRAKGVSGSRTFFSRTAIGMEFRKELITIRGQHSLQAGEEVGVLRRLRTLGNAPPSPGGP